MKGANAPEKKMRIHIDVACDIEIRDRVMVSDEARASLGRFGEPVSGKWKLDSSLRNSAVRRAFIGKVPFIGISEPCQCRFGS
jgi:hypothetical protein